MLRLTLCHSYTKTRKMKTRKRISVLDYSYIALCLFITWGFISRFEIHISERGANTPLHIQQVQAKEDSPEKTVIKYANDPRPKRLQSFLESKHSPLAPYAEYIVQEADKYGIDWTKIVSISYIESKYGTLMPKNSHNAWGIGGDNFMYFNSWEDGIEYESALLGKHYKQNENLGIKSKYCPASDNCNPEWADRVTEASNEILQLEDNL